MLSLTIHMPGFGFPPIRLFLLKLNDVSIECAVLGLLAVASRIGSDTGIGDIDPMRTTLEALVPSLAPVSSAIKLPILWPTRALWAMPQLSMTAIIHVAMASIDVKESPPDRPCPGRSIASTFQLCREK